jgi:hypothetical protein
MLPELPIAVFSLDCFAGEPLLLPDAFHVLVAVLIEPMVPHKEGLGDVPILPDCDHRQILDIEIDRDRHQVGVLFALLHFLRLDCFDLREVQGSGISAQDQFGTLLLPGWVCPTCFKVATLLDRIVVPFPCSSGVDLQSGKRLSQISFIQFKREGSLVEGRVIAGSWGSRPPLLFAGRSPVRQVGEIRASFANGILDHRATIGKGHVREVFTKVPVGPGVRVLFRCDRLEFGPGQQLVGGNEPFPFLLISVGDRSDPLRELL